MTNTARLPRVLVTFGKRLSALIAVLFGVSLITFTMNYFAPGDKAAAIAHARYPDANGFPPEILEGIRQEFSLNEPFFVQFFQWLWRFVQGDFGNSFASNTRGLGHLSRQRFRNPVADGGFAVDWSDRRLLLERRLGVAAGQSV